MDVLTEKQSIDNVIGFVLYTMIYEGKESGLWEANSFSNPPSFLSPRSLGTYVIWKKHLGMILMALQYTVKPLGPIGTSYTEVPYNSVVEILLF